MDVSPFFRDPDAGRLAYTATSSAPPVLSASMSGSDLTMTGVATGAATVTVTATDPDGLSATQTVGITVEAANRPPEVVAALPEQTMMAGQTVTIDVSSVFSDPDGDELTYEAESSNAGVVTVGSEGASLTMMGVAPDTASVTVTAADPGGLSAMHAMSVTVTEAGGVILAVTFDATPLGDYTRAAFDSDWPSAEWVTGLGAGRAAIVGGPAAYSGRSLRLKYPTNTYGSQNQAIQARIDLPRNYEELYVSYRVRFEDGFDFVKGGKLPGLYGGSGNTGGNRPNGTDGWSGRMMWRRDGDAVQYVYHPDQPGSFGQDFRWERRFGPGTWHTIEHRFVMNTPGKNDGVLQTWFDGEESLHVQDLRFRDIDTFAIDGFYISTFFGGADSTWAPTKDEYILLDDIVVSTLPINETASSDAAPAKCRSAYGFPPPNAAWIRPTREDSTTWRPNSDLHNRPTGGDSRRPGVERKPPRPETVARRDPWNAGEKVRGLPDAPSTAQKSTLTTGLPPSSCDYTCELDSNDSRVHDSYMNNRLSLSESPIAAPGESRNRGEHCEHHRSTADRRSRGTPGQVPHHVEVRSGRVYS